MQVEPRADWRGSCGKTEPAGRPAEGVCEHDGLGSRAGGVSESGAAHKLNGIDQLWVADITYIRLQAEFVYLAVILDGYSRKVVSGWNWIARLRPTWPSKRCGEQSSYVTLWQAWSITPIAGCDIPRLNISRFSSSMGWFRV